MISTCVIVKNEEKLIERCLSSLVGVVDEILLVHDGSCSDNTLEIAKRFTDKIFERPFAGFMESHLPFCFETAKNDWVLRIDADEYISGDLKKFLLNFKGDEVAAYEVIWPLWDGSKERTERWPYKRVLVNKTKASFLALPHFIIRIDGEVKKLDIKLNHEPSYNNYSLEVFFRKSVKWARLQADLYFKNFETIERYNFKETDFPKTVRLRKRFSILIALPDLINTIIKTLKEGAFNEGVYGIKAALMFGAYNFILDMFIIINQFKKWTSRL